MKPKKKGGERRLIPRRERELHSFMCLERTALQRIGRGAQEPRINCTEVPGVQDPPSPTSTGSRGLKGQVGTY